MGHRTGVVITKLEPAPSLPSPNAVVPQITVEIRAYWPPAMGNDEKVLDMLTAAYNDARRKVQHAAGSNPPAQIHRHAGRFCLDCETDVSWCTHPSVRS